MNHKLKEFLENPMGSIPDWLISWAVFLGIGTLITLMLCFFIGEILGK